MCLKYSIGLFKAHSKDAIYHVLAKSLKFSTTKMQCLLGNHEDFNRVVTGPWVKIRGEQIFFGK